MKQVEKNNLDTPSCDECAQKRRIFRQHTAKLGFAVNIRRIWALQNESQIVIDNRLQEERNLGCTRQVVKSAWKIQFLTKVASVHLYFPTTFLKLMAISSLYEPQSRCCVPVQLNRQIPTKNNTLAPKPPQPRSGEKPVPQGQPITSPAGNSQKKQTEAAHQNRVPPPVSKAGYKYFKSLFLNHLSRIQLLIFSDSQQIKTTW